MEEYTNPILQKVCADALISISDEDSDGELSFQEFMKCLNPGVYQESPYSKSPIVNPRRLIFWSKFDQGKPTREEGFI